MAKITLTGTPAHTIGELPKIGDLAVNFSLTGPKLSTVSLEDYANKNIVLNIFPSIDTNTCASSVRQFNKLASDLNNTVVLCISADLPFAQWRFCGAEGIGNVYTLSTFRDGGKFGKDYGVTMIDGPLHGLLARAVIVIDQQQKVVYSQLVSEINNEPDYEATLKVLR